MIGLLFGLALSIDTDLSSQFERDLGFPLPAPFEWRGEFSEAEPVYVNCNDAIEARCTQFGQDHWLYVGVVGAARDSGRWGDTPPLTSLLRENGWIAMRPAARERVTNWRRTEGLEIGTCAKYIVLDYGYRDALGLTMRVVPCLDGIEQ
ncbi:hypothetical protein [Maricaulis sp.]|uniref:hypothetical protein n=1 Tax=Maricaulis sp. TaxID=1486257 RepID=UPI001B0D9EA7|nr:hypothetical protein [Maricaulis sp.]MBO6796042.1 hypothetical protein [Maricaulis sp.]